MSDLFHENVPEEFIGRVFEVTGLATQHEATRGAQNTMGEKQKSSYLDEHAFSGDLGRFIELAAVACRRPARAAGQRFA
jgi:hypothetical protein